MFMRHAERYDKVKALGQNLASFHGMGQHEKRVQLSSNMTMGIKDAWLTIDQHENEKPMRIGGFAISIFFKKPMGLNFLCFFK